MITPPASASLLPALCPACFALRIIATKEGPTCRHVARGTGASWFPKNWDIGLNECLRAGVSNPPDVRIAWLETPEPRAAELVAVSART